MTKERLIQILNEKELNPSAYQKDGYKYFEETLPILAEYLQAQEDKKDFENQHRELVQSIKMENKKVVKKKR